MLSYTHQLGHADHALFANQLHFVDAGYAVESGCTISTGTDPYDVDVAAGEVLVDGTEVAVAGQTVSVRTPDSSPRWDAIYVDVNGDVQIREGDPHAPAPQDNRAMHTRLPAPPDFDADPQTVIALVYVDSERSELRSDDLIDRRVDSAVAAGTVSAAGGGGGNPAQSGAVRLSNAAWVTARDSADAADIDLVRLNSSDLLDFGAAAAGVSLGDGYGVDVAEDGGAETLADMSVTDAPAAGTEESYAFSIDGGALLKAYAEADGAGTIQNAMLRALAPLRVMDDTSLELGAGGDYSVTYDSASGNLQIVDEVNATSVLNLPTNTPLEDVLKDGGNHELDASELAGSAGTAGEVLTSDGAAAAWKGVPRNELSQNVGRTSLSDGEMYVMHRFTVPTGSDLEIYAAGVADDAGNVPTGLAVEVYNHTDAAVEHSTTVTYEDGNPLTTLTTVAGDDIEIRINNGTGAGGDFSGFLTGGVV